jgi:hypothetical protein
MPRKDRVRAQTAPARHPGTARRDRPPPMMPNLERNAPVPPPQSVSKGPGWHHRQVEIALLSGGRAFR